MATKVGMPTFCGRTAQAKRSNEAAMRLQLLYAAGLALIVSACNAAGTNPGMPSTVAGTVGGAGLSDQVPSAVDTTSVLKLLTKQEVIGSTVDPKNGDQNPHGLVYVPSKPFGNSPLKKGDLIVCNFNDKNNVQRNGTTMEYMTSTPGSTPKTFLQSSTIKGCASLVINSLDSTFSADSGVKNVAGWSPKPANLYTFTNPSIIEPFGTAYAPASIDYPPGDGIFVGDAYTGGITRINLNGIQPPPSIVVGVIRGFPYNHGKPGAALGPSGMQYDKKADTLYVVDGVNHTLYAFSKAYNDIDSAKAIVIGKDGKSFTGPKAKDARVVYSGSALNAPISSALLPNGNLVIANSVGPNVLVEIDTAGKVLATKNIDKGAAGAIFGIVAVGTSDANTQIFFNDDNANNVQLLTR
jgi:hypothetical protein